MAMQLGYRFFPQIAGVFSLSSFLNQNSLVYQVSVPLLSIYKNIILYYTINSKFRYSTFSFILSPFFSKGAKVPYSIIYF